MRLLFIGDVFGAPGRQAVQEILPGLRRDRKIDVVVANGENASHGRGITQKTADILFQAGVDVITTGNHAFDIVEAFPYFESETRLVRPANYSKAAPGRGYVVLDILGGVQLAVINLIGRIHMEPVDCPFAKVDEILEDLRSKSDIIFVDMHAEATSEARAMGWHLDGKVAAVLGSHTHVPTADEEILPQGTAYITDVGMTGPYRSVIGMDLEPVLNKYRTGLRTKFQPATEDIRFCGALVDIEESTGKATHIERVCETLGAAS